MDALAVDIEGLNLILGGGVPVLKRHETFADKSATLLLRGPPGSGKTVFGTHLASSLARSLGADVAYACVELLPSELAAQRAALRPTGLRERVLQPPFRREERTGKECRIYAGTLDLGTPVDEQERLVPAIEELLTAVREVGGHPRVLVVDSLSDGYHLGGSAPRPLADELCKMAVHQGMILVLLEETSDDVPSAWSFATDVVLQLGSGDEGSTSSVADSSDRRLVVAKNRLGPSEPGVHRFAILPSWGVRVLPNPRAYLSKWAPRLLWPDWKNDHLRVQGWSIKVPPSWPRFQDCVTAVYGGEATDVRRLAGSLGVSTTRDQPFEGADIFLDFSRDDASIEPAEMHPGELWKIGCGDPYLRGEELLAVIVANIDELKDQRRPIRRILVGDLQSLRSFWNPEGIRHALGVLVSMLRRVHLPAVLFETAIPRVVTTEEGIGTKSETFPVPPPRIVDFADVVVEVQAASPGHGQPVFASHARSGQQVRLR